MGQVSYSGQVIKYVGGTSLLVSNTVLSASGNVDRMFAGASVTNPSFITYQPGLPDFLQGFTSFQPGSTYGVYIASTEALPITGLANFEPPVTNSLDGMIARSGVSWATGSATNRRHWARYSSPHGKSWII